MPSYAHDLDGKRVSVARYRREQHEGKIVCPDCGALMRYQREIPLRRIDYFAHMPRLSGDVVRKCAWAGMRAEHHNALRSIVEHAPLNFNMLDGVVGVEEVSLKDRTRRADVFFAGDTSRYAVAFEAQFSRITYGANGTGRTIEERTRDYYANEAHVVWCFFEHLPWAHDLMETCLRVYGYVGVLSKNGMSVVFHGMQALKLDTHPIDVMEMRQSARIKKITAVREEQERMRREEQERMRREEQERKDQESYEEDRRLARMELRRKENAQLFAEIDERRKAESAERERKQREYELCAEARRIAAQAAEEDMRKARITKANRRLGVTLGVDGFTVEPVDHPPCPVLGLPARVMYRILWKGMPTGWTSAEKVSSEISRLNALRGAKKKKGGF